MSESIQMTVARLIDNNPNKTKEELEYIINNSWLESAKEAAIQEINRQYLWRNS